MNYKTMLLASAAVLFANQAMAQDITGTFAVPGAGQFTSDTSIGMTRAKTKWTAPGGSMTEAEDGAYISEVVEYGLTDQFSVNAGIANEFDKEGGYNNDHNFLYNVGAKYNTRKDDVLLQAAASYTTLNPHDYYGHHSGVGNKWKKILGLDLKAGLDLGNGITPYIVYSIDSVIDDNHRPLEQSVSAGIHKYTGQWALDGAVRYEWTSNDKDNWARKNSTEWWLDASADYYLKDNVVIGAYGSYLLDSKDKKLGGFKEHESTTYELGLHVKFLF